MDKEEKRRIGHYIDNGDGTVTDTCTGLTWMRCAMGQTWDGQTCQGKAKNYTWYEAKKFRHTFAGYDDWRLPDVDELKTLIDTGQGNPAIDRAAFPNAVQSFFWSSSPHPVHSDSALGVHFVYGSVHNYFKHYSFDVRVVRGGQWKSGLVGLLAKISRFICGEQSRGSLVEERPPKSSPTKALPEILPLVPDGIKSSTLMTPGPATTSQEIIFPVGSSDPPVRIGHYIDNGDGTVTDTRTGLTWMRCAMGQTWDGKTCQGEVKNYTWDEAMKLRHTFAGYDDWRLPDIDELKTLIDTSQNNPALDRTAFPNTLPSSFWSSSPNASYSGSAWNVYFSYGHAYSSYKYYSYDVRLVRGGQCLGDLGEERLEQSSQAKALLEVLPLAHDGIKSSVLMTPGPATTSQEIIFPVGSSDPPVRIGHYIDNGDGTVTDTRTGLTWMRCAMGQTWDGKTCQGEVKNYTWDEAMKLRHTFAGYDDWRLPDIDELKTLIDTSQNNPAIDRTVFPNTLPLSFWSSSPDAYGSNSAWYVDFYGGNVSYYGKSNSYDVRLVRGGQCLGALVEERLEQSSPAKALPVLVNSSLSPKDIQSNVTTSPGSIELEEIISPIYPSNLPVCVGHYIDNGDGTVTDTRTGLTWMRCAMGQTWDGKTCQGEAQNFTWDEAMRLRHTFVGYEDWRLPDIDELKTLIDQDQGISKIDKTAFPTTRPSALWSSSPHANGSSCAWYVIFSSGYVNDISKSNRLDVRLVRGGQEGRGTLVEERPPQPLPAKVPPLVTFPFNHEDIQPNGTTSPGPIKLEEKIITPVDPNDSPISIGQYIDNGDGTVTDTRTGLTWMRCAMGQTLHGKMCFGAVKKYTWDAATKLRHTFAGHDDWRLPDIDELKTLIDKGQGSPAIDKAAFPNTLRSLFWSSSPDDDGPGGALVIYFGSGDVYGGYEHSSLVVRLVRGGQCLDDLGEEKPHQPSPTKALPEILLLAHDGIKSSALMTPGPATTSQEIIFPVGSSDPPVRIGHYIDNADGTVTDTRIGLTWMRCAMGQTWDGKTCQGEVKGYSWDEAVKLRHTFAGHDDWRLPDIDELKTLIYTGQDNPAIDRAAFPNTLRSPFWSSSPYAANSNYAWNVDFYDGYVDYNYKNSSYDVRLVRGGQCLGALAEESPSQFSPVKALPVVHSVSDYQEQGHKNGKTLVEMVAGIVRSQCSTKNMSTEDLAFALDNTFKSLHELQLQETISTVDSSDSPVVIGHYIDNADGTVTDTRTGLTWMRCAMGQTWDGKSCQGEARSYTWDEAMKLRHTFAGYDDWRLPDIEEMKTLIDTSQNDSSIDKAAFPNTPRSLFWSSSPHANHSNYAWDVDLYYGYVSYNYKYSSYAVRLVRGGQCLGDLGEVKPHQPSPTKALPEILPLAHDGIKSSALMTPGPATTSQEIISPVGSSDPPVRIGHYNDNSDGTVTDARTGLTWMRCAMGQTWDGKMCQGEAQNYTWDEAMRLRHTFAGYDDWRLPDIDELKTLIDRGQGIPTIDRAAFPSTPPSYFWSSSPYAYNSYNAWGVDFSYGNVNHLKGSGYDVRLVRGGQCLGDLGEVKPHQPSPTKALPEILPLSHDGIKSSALMTPGPATTSQEIIFPVGSSDPPVRIGHYIDNANGTVTDTRTGLTWMRCAMGQTWDGKTCQGEAKNYTWDEAMRLRHTFAGYDDWRLPDIDELKTLIDTSQNDSSIDKAAFPNTPRSLFWSSSPYAYGSSNAWHVSFYTGYVSYNGKNNSYDVRLVRGGQCLGALVEERLEQSSQAKALPEILSLAHDGIKSSALMTPGPATTSKEIIFPAGSSDSLVRIDYYIDNGDGTVTDTRTGLTWMRCAMGQTWDGKTCQEEAQNYTWDEAMKLRHTFAGHDDWRLPDIDELKTLIDTSQSNTAIDKTAFPNTFRKDFWSSSTYAGASGLAWSVDFRDGYVGSYDKDHMNRRFGVCFVRGGQYLGTLNQRSVSSAKDLHGTEIAPRINGDGVPASDPIWIATSVDVVRQVIDQLLQLRQHHPALVAAKISELRALLDSISTEMPIAPVEKKDVERTETASLPHVLSWLADQDRVSLADLRQRLLPLDLFPGAVIDDINEQALDLAGELALEEDGDSVLVVREVLLQVIAAKGTT